MVSHELSSDGQLSFSAVRRDLTDLVELWRQQGLLDTPDTALAGGSSVAREIVGAGLQVFRKTQWRVLEICGVTISVGIASPQMEEMVEARLGHARVREKSGRHVLGLKSIGDEHILLEGNLQLFRSPNAQQVFAAFVRRCAELVNPGTDWLAVLHAAAVRSPGGKTLVLPGKNGSGKSTLVRHMMAHEFGYFSDDCVPITEAGHVVAMPFAICLKESGWATSVLDRREVHSLPTRTNHLGVSCKYLPPARVCTVPSPIDLIIFPQFDRFADSGLSRMSPEEALMEIVASRAWISRTPSQIRRFLGLLERVPAYGLRYASSDVALALLEDIGIG